MKDTYLLTSFQNWFQKFSNNSFSNNIMPITNYKNKKLFMKEIWY